MTKSSRSDTFQMPRGDGNVYEVTKQGYEDWLISYPEGDKRFFGTRAEVKALVKKMIKETEDDQETD